MISRVKSLGGELTATAGWKLLKLPQDVEQFRPLSYRVHVLTWYIPEPCNEKRSRMLTLGFM